MLCSHYLFSCSFSFSTSERAPQYLSTWPEFLSTLIVRVGCPGDLRQWDVHCFKSFPKQYWGKCQGTEVLPAFPSVAPSALFCLILPSPCPQQGSQGQGLVLAVWLQGVRGAMAVVCTCAGWHGWVSDQPLPATKAEKFNKQSLACFALSGQAEKQFLLLVNTAILLTMNNNTRLSILNP